MRTDLTRVAFCLLACLIGAVEEGQAQPTAPQQVKDLSEAFSTARKDWQITYRPDVDTRLDLGFPQYGLSRRGLVLRYEADPSKILCIDASGNIVWERRARPGTGIGWAQVSPDGDYIYIYQGIDETEGISEMLDADGESLWHHVTGGGYFFSPSGAYLVSEESLLGYMPLSVVDTRTGTVLWQSQTITSSFEAHALTDDLVVCLYRPKCRIILFDLKTGQLLWERGLIEKLQGDPNHYDWTMSTASSGNRIAVLGRGLETSSVFVFDTTGNLIWEGRGDGRKRTYVSLVGLTNNGKFLAISNLEKSDGLSLMDIDRKQIVWTVDGRIDTNEPFLTDHLIVLRNKLDTRLFLIAPDGRLLKHIKLDDYKRVVILGRSQEPGSDPSSVSAPRTRLLTVSYNNGVFQFSRGSILPEEETP